MITIKVVLVVIVQIIEMIQPIKFLIQQQTRMSIYQNQSIKTLRTMTMHRYRMILIHFG